MHKDGWNVAMSPRHDVPTSRRLNVATSRSLNVATSRSLNVATSRSLNVATSQRRVVATSRRCNVATSRRQRELCLSIIKRKKGTRIQRGVRRSRTYELGPENHHSSRTLTLEKSHHFVSSSFRTKRLMFYRLTICVFSFSMF